MRGIRSRFLRKAVLAFALLTSFAGSAVLFAQGRGFQDILGLKGKGGTAKGGSYEFFQVINGETNVTVPGTGTSEFGHGGISSIREFCPPGTNVPDSGTTALLLGSALTGLGVVRRYIKR